MITKQELLAQLNENQREAVMFNDGPSLVIAGAGSGKTRVLTFKIAYLLLEGYSPSTILALTFTNKAAREMKNRISDLVGANHAKYLWMGTFHSIFSRMLRAEAEKIGFTSNFTIYDSSDSRSVVKGIIKSMSLDDKIYKPAFIHQRISFAKNNLISASAYESFTQLMNEDKAMRIPLFSEIFYTYSALCHQANAMDFDDLLLYTNVLFRDFPDVLENYRQRFQFILVDEYQDTNLAQHAIIKRLSEVHKHIAVVGDDAQSIYSFRGANIDNILQFRNQFPECKLFKLEQNYRSTKNIVAAANSLIKKNVGQIPKNVFSEKDKGSRIQLISAITDQEEGFVVADKIAHLHYSEHHPYNDCAILYRTNAQSRILEEALRKRNIPYRIYGGLSFYQRKEIRDVLAYFRLIINPSDDEALKRCINYPARGIGETTMHKIGDVAHQYHVSLWNVIGNLTTYPVPINKATVQKLTLFYRLIHELSTEAASLNAYEMAVKIVKSVGIQDEMNADRLAETINRRENIQELLNAIHLFCDKKTEEGVAEMALSDFLSEVSLLTDQDIDQETDAEKVTLMTIHAAKGLEFRNIFIVGMEEELFPSAYVAGERELEEERRLFYVALTRAQEHCFITFARSRFRNGQLNFTNPSRFLNDIDREFIEMPTQFHTSNFNGSSGKSRSLDDFPVNDKLSFPSSAQKIFSSNADSTWKKITPKPSTEGLQSSKSFSNGGGLTVGDHVVHEKFGSGTVLALEKMDDNWKATVDFADSGIKILLLKYAKLKRVE
ncbi:MAG: UvrD-helicase domain-containing protein [Microbacter sp.]